MRVGFLGIVTPKYLLFRSAEKSVPTFSPESKELMPEAGVLA
jgi:hypothetical protein